MKFFGHYPYPQPIELNVWQMLMTPVSVIRGVIDAYIRFIKERVQ